MQAIVTKYIGPTSTCWALIKATASVGSVTIAYDDYLSDAHAHRKAALALCVKFGWRGVLHEGGMHDGFVYEFPGAEGTFEIPELQPKEQL